MSARITGVVTRILVDANVLFSKTLRDWLLILQIESEASIFTTCWTEDIAAEVFAKLRKAHPHLDGDVIADLRQKIEQSMTEKIDSYRVRHVDFLLDVHDHHVHAAAVEGGVDTLLTSDKGFLHLSEETKDALPYEIVHPDDLFFMVGKLCPDLISAVAQVQSAYLARRGSAVDLAERLRAAECPRFAAQV